MVGLKLAPERTTSHRAIVVNSTEATDYGHCRSSRHDISWPTRRVCDVDAFMGEVLTELAAMATDGTRAQRARGMQSH